MAIAAIILYFSLQNEPIPNPIPPGVPLIGRPDIDTQLPAPPRNLDADDLAVFDINVMWQDASDNEDGFNVYRRRLDVFSERVFAGAGTENATEFLDLDTYCGATYQYTVASFNEAGESPATTCWQITLPECPVPVQVPVAYGPENGRNYLDGSLGPTADFYLTGLDGTTILVKSDLPGQRGIVDLGIVGDTPLHRVTLPGQAAYGAGAPARAGDTYAALARDGESVIVFRFDALGAEALVTYIIWRPGEKTVSACDPVAQDKPGGICISGDNICDPACTPAAEPTRDTPVSLTTLASHTDLTPGTGIHVAPVVRLIADEFREAVASGTTNLRLLPEYTTTDLDCSEFPCDSYDGVCVPVCGQSSGDRDASDELAFLPEECGWCVAEIINVDWDCLPGEQGSAAWCGADPGAYEPGALCGPCPTDNPNCYPPVSTPGYYTPTPDGTKPYSTPTVPYSTQPPYLTPQYVPSATPTLDCSNTLTHVNAACITPQYAPTLTPTADCSSTLTHVNPACVTPNACVCGDLACNPNCKEDSTTCALDCPPSGGGYCGAPCTDSSQCTPGLSCFQGVCWNTIECSDPTAEPTGTPVGTACAPGLTLCGGGCVDLSSDAGNCGACGKVCTHICSSGTCK